MASKGKRAGARRGAKAPRQLNKAALAYGIGITACVIAWGYLVYAAIDFGTAGRGGSGSAWGLMAFAAVGAMACLFFGLMLIARLMRTLGITSEPDSSSPSSTSSSAGHGSPESSAPGSSDPGSSGPWGSGSSGSSESGGSSGSGSSGPRPPRVAGGKRAAR